LTAWFFRDTERLLREKAAVEALAAERGWFELHDWVLHEGLLTVDGAVVAHGVTYPIYLVYPNQFPSVPAFVCPQEGVRWSLHQFGEGGSLCLELRPDNWVATYTGVDVLDSAYRLLDQENPLGSEGEKGAVVSAHAVGQIQTYSWLNNPLLISAGCCARLLGGTAENVQAIRWRDPDSFLWPTLVVDAVDRLSPRIPLCQASTDFQVNVPVTLSYNPPPSGAPTRADVAAAAPLLPPAEGLFTDQALVLFVNDDSIVAYGLVGEESAYKRDIYMLPNQEGRRSGRSTTTAAVAIVGAGSVGSKLADSLVRSGVQHLSLADGDVLLPANLERHALTWRGVGLRKVSALKQHLLEVMPGAKIKTIERNLNWQGSPKEHALRIDQIANSAVIVDATGDPATALFLGAIAAANKKPFVSVEVFEGGVGALIASCLPGRDPPFVDARGAFLSWCEQQNTPPPASGPRQYEALAADGTPVVADDAAVTMAAGHAARVVLDILDGRPAPREAAWLLAGFAKGWVFEGHGHNIHLSVGTPREETFNVAANQGALTFIAGLIEELRRADSPHE